MIRRLEPGEEGWAEGAYAYAAFDGDEAVGWVYGHDLAHPDGRATTLLYSLDVAEHARGRGHGRALVERFVADARARGSGEVWVLTEGDNAAANATYAAAGGTRETGEQVMYVWPS